MTYFRFGAMILTSTVVMFGLMYLNTYVWEHVAFSETRTYMAILMGATMAVIMMGYMFPMYSNKKANIGIFIVSALVFALSLWLVRSQATVGQVSYMRAMIPHHSIAIMTSKRADIADPRVRALADEIYEAQEREIAEMRYLIAQLDGNGTAAPMAGSGAMTQPEPSAQVVTLAEALARTETATLHLQPIPAAEAAGVLPPGPGCEFAWTADSQPILIARASTVAEGGVVGIMKLQGALVPLVPVDAADFLGVTTGPTLTADGAEVRVTPAVSEQPSRTNGRQRWDADLVFTLDQGRVVGYRGFYTCDAS